jgi:signal peptidase I
MPPLVVVESESMMHSESGEVGAIDAGDLILVHSTPFEQIITFAEASNTSHASYGYEQHGMYGDVIIFKKNGGNETPIIHRAILEVQPTDFTSSIKEGEDPCPNGGIFDDEWLDENGEPGVCVTTWQIPGTSIQGVFAHEGLSQHLSIQDWQPKHAGFLTLGDNNHCSVDQRRVISSGGSLDGPVRASWMIGTAGGEIPWLGTVKLMVSGPPSPGTFYVPSSSFTFLFLIVGVVFISPLVYEKVAKRILSNSPEFQALKYYPEEE